MAKYDFFKRQFPKFFGDPRAGSKPTGDDKREPRDAYGLAVGAREAREAYKDLKSSKAPRAQPDLYQYFMKVGAEFNGQSQSCHRHEKTEVDLEVGFNFGALVAPGLEASLSLELGAKKGTLTVFNVTVHPLASDLHLTRDSVCCATMVGSSKGGSIKLSAELGVKFGGDEDAEKPEDPADADEDKSGEKMASSAGVAELLAWKCEASALGKLEGSVQLEWFAVMDPRPRHVPRNSRALKEHVEHRILTVHEIVENQCKAIAIADSSFADDLKEYRQPGTDLLENWTFTSRRIDDYCEKILDHYKVQWDRKNLDEATRADLQQQACTFMYDLAPFTPSLAFAGMIEATVRPHFAAIKNCQIAEDAKDIHVAREKHKIALAVLDTYATMSRKELARPETFHKFILSLHSEFRILNALGGSGAADTAISPFRAQWLALYSAADQLRRELAATCSLTMWGMQAGLSGSAEAKFEVPLVSATASLGAGSCQAKRTGYRFQSAVPAVLASKESRPIHVRRTQETIVRYGETRWTGPAFSVEGKVGEDNALHVTKEWEGQENPVYRSMSYVSATVHWFYDRYLNEKPHVVTPGNGYTFGRVFEPVNLEREGLHGRWFSELARELHVPRKRLRAFFRKAGSALCKALQEDPGFTDEALLLEATFVADLRLAWKAGNSYEIAEFLEKLLADEDTRLAAGGKPQPIRHLQSIRLRYRIAHDSSDEASMFKFGFDLAGATVGLAGRKILQRGSFGVVDLHTEWFGPTLPTMSKDPGRSVALHDNAVPPAILFLL